MMQWLADNVWIALMINAAAPIVILLLCFCLPNPPYMRKRRAADKARREQGK